MSLTDLKEFEFMRLSSVTSLVFQTVKTSLIRASLTFVRRLIYSNASDDA
jgi:hypothetical protein